jgi:hypothetical protein
MNFDMLSVNTVDYTTTLFLSIVVCITLILGAQCIRTCFESIGPSDIDRNANLLQNRPRSIIKVCNEHLPNQRCSQYEYIKANFPSPIEPSNSLDDALCELSDTSTDSSYVPDSPHPDDSNLEDAVQDSVWVRRRRSPPRLERISLAPPSPTKECSTFCNSCVESLPFHA